MQETESRGTTVIRYIFWIIFAGITIFLRESAVSKNGLNLILAIVAFVVGLVTVQIMSHRYKRERQLLNIQKRSMKATVINNFGFIMVMIILIAVVRIAISVAQFQGMLPKFKNDYLTSADQKVFIFNLVINILIISYQQFMVSDAFLYNYFWKKDSDFSYALGILMSGIVLAIINLSTTPIQMLLFFLIGSIYAIIYRRTNDSKLTLMIIIFSNIIGSILI